MKSGLAGTVSLVLLATVGIAQTAKLDQAIAKADELLAKGRPAEAVKALTKAAGEAGAAGQVALGRLQERAGDLEAAAAAYEAVRATAAGGDKAELLPPVAQFLLRRGKADEAQKVAREAVEARATAAGLAVLARAQVRLQDATGALATADKAVAAGASSALAQLARGEALLALGRAGDAETALRRAVELEPASALVQSRLALALVALKRPAEAVAAARRATELDDKLGEGFAALGLALIAADPKQNWGDAIAHAQTGATTLDTENPLVHTAVGTIFEVNGQLDQAASEYRRAAQIEPTYGPARAALVRLEIVLGHRDAVVPAIEADLAAGKTVPADVLRLLGQETLRRGDSEGAIRYLEQATRAVPGDAEGWALLGRALHLQGRKSEAATAFAAAVKLAPQNLDYRASYGLVLGQAGDLAGAAAELQAVTGSDGYKDAAGWANLGWVYRSLDKPQESIAAYRRALELDPKQGQAALGLGWAYSNTKAYDDAVAAYARAIEADPRSAGLAHAGIAWTYVFRRQPANARAELDKATAAGVGDARLRQFVEALEKAVAEGRPLTEEDAAAARKAQAADQARQRVVEAAIAGIASKSAEVRAAAARDLASLVGAGAIDALIYLMQADSEYEVRIAATNALARLGPSARKAIPNIEGILRQPAYEPPIHATEAELLLKMKDYDYRKALAAARVRIRG